MTFQEYQELHERCTAGNCTPEEQQAFESYRDGFNLSDTAWTDEFGDQKAIEKLLKQDLHSRLTVTPVKSLKRYYWSAAAAVLVAGGLYFAANYLNVEKGKPHQLVAVKAPVGPGTDRAVLTLSNGRTIALNNSAEGVLSTESNVVVDKDNATRVIYKKDKAGHAGAMLAYNIMTTPRGGKYALVLADGTKVWLNAATTLRYPVDFTGQERVVELSGEAYFEVAHNKAKPFKVVSQGQVVQVLGTHFNINAYADEDAVKTTLLQGNVKVYSNAGPKGTAGPALMIRPNEQATFKSNRFTKTTVDAEDMIAWKNGSMLFKNADLKSIMRQVSRWYDVEVTYSGRIADDDTYSGEISRNANLDEVVKALKLNDINMKVNGKTITVLP